MIGGRGADSLDGGSGADRILARDGSREAVRCGTARDRATTDVVDMAFGCERRSKGTWNWHSGAKKRRRGARARKSTAAG
jgi:Ca2+-binding RTX toxin-like protein